MEPTRSKKEDGEESKETRDPFAVDIFGAVSKPEVPIVPVSLKQVRARPLPAGVVRDWHSGLESLPKGRKEGSLASPKFPGWLEVVVNEQLMPSFRKFLNPSDGPVHFEVIAFEDGPANSILEKLKGAPNLFVKIEFAGVIGLVSLSTELVGVIIDGVLSGPGSEPGDLRALSKIELAICEYVAGVSFSKLNDLIDGHSRLRILSVGNEPPAGDFESGRMAEIVGDLAAGSLSGMVSVLMPFEMADALNVAFRDSDLPDEKSKKKVKSESSSSETGIYLRVGRTIIPAVEIPFLEPEDIVLISDPETSWWGKQPVLGRFVCYAGASSNIRIEGETSINQESGSVEIQVRDAFSFQVNGDISSIRDGKPGMGVNIVEKEELEAKNESEDTQTEDMPAVEEIQNDGGRGLIALENVMVDLRVQVAGRKISLSELGKIHSGQIIDLGCRPEDPVELIAESSDRPIAAGELVKIEDQLGVRVTKVFV